MKGIGFRHRQEAMTVILEWWEKGYLVTEGIASVKTLADWASERFLFLSKTGNPLSYNTIKQELGETERDLRRLNSREGTRGRKRIR